MIGVPIAYVWARLNLRGLEVDRRPLGGPPAGGRRRSRSGSPSRTSAGSRRSGWRSTTRARCPATTRAASSRCRRRATKTFRVRSTIGRRGLYTIGPVEVTTGDPFGLFQHTRTFGRAQNVLVYPRATELPNFSVPAGEPAGRRPLPPAHALRHAERLRRARRTSPATASTASTGRAPRAPAS